MKPVPQTDPATVEHMLSRVRTKLTEHNAWYPDLPVQLSFGASTVEHGMATWQKHLTWLISVCMQRKPSENRKANDPRCVDGEAILCYAGYGHS